MPKATYPKSPSGYYKVTLSKAVPRRGFSYRPGRSITVTEAVLKDMISAEAVASVAAA